MTLEEELIRFGDAMFRFDEQGNRIHIPREEWRCDYVPDKPKT